MTTKGDIDIKGMKEEQLFNLIEEYIRKAKDDSLNLKEHEHELMFKILPVIKKEYYKNKRFADFIKPVLTPKQIRDYMEYLEQVL